MEEIIKKLSAAEVKALMELMKLSATKGDGSGSVHSHNYEVRSTLPHVDLKFDGPTTYLS
jgi:hypothetical protein